MDNDAEALTAMEAGIAEANRRTSGEFDGLLGSLPREASVLLSDIVEALRWVLLDKYSDDEVRVLLQERIPPLAGPGDIAHWHTTPVPDDIELALYLLNLIGSATRCEGDRFLKIVLGPAGLRDARRQAGTRRPKRPDIATWLDAQLERNPAAKSPALWQSAPEWITDQIGQERFAKRVTAARKRTNRVASR